MDNAKISIITVCKNAHGLDRTCKSIINQSFGDFQWIVVDGGSNKKILDVFSKYKYRINFFVSKKDNGIYDAMNKGIRHANGQYLLFLNAGDYFYNNHSLESFVQGKLDTDIIYANLLRTEKKALETFPKKLDKNFFIRSYLPHPATLIKRKLFEEYGLYDTSLNAVSDYKKFIEFLYIHHCTYKHLDFISTCFGIGGVSNTIQSAQERAQVLHEYFTPKELMNAFKSGLSWSQKIFSINRYVDGNYKAITILGLTFLYKNSNKQKGK